MSREAHPQVGSVLFDLEGVSYLVIKTWPWEDRVSALSQGHVELVSLDKLSARDFDSIFSANEVNDGKDRSTNSSREEPSRRPAQPETA